MPSTTTNQRAKPNSNHEARRTTDAMPTPKTAMIGTTVSVATSEDGAQTMNLTKSDYGAATSTITGAANLAAITVDDVSTAINAIATARAPM